MAAGRRQRYGQCNKSAIEIDCFDTDTAQCQPVGRMAVDLFVGRIEDRVRVAR